MRRRLIAAVHISFMKIGYRMIVCADTVDNIVFM